MISIRPDCDLSHARRHSFDGGATQAHHDSTARTDYVRETTNALPVVRAAHVLRTLRGQEEAFSHIIAQIYRARSLLLTVQSCLQSAAEQELGESRWL